MVTNKLLIFGGGYVGQALYKSVKNNFPTITMTKRFPQHEYEIAFDNYRPLESSVFHNVTHILITIPPVDGHDPVLKYHRDNILKCSTLCWVGYLSSTSVYGDHHGNWINEWTSPQPDTATALNRYSAEQQWQNLWDYHIPVHIFRLSGIYGLGRSALESLIDGKAQIIYKKGHVFNYIHIDDIIQILKISMNHPTLDRPIYNLADDLPSSSLNVYRYASHLINRALPNIKEYCDADVSPRMQEFFKNCRRVANQHVKDKLDIRLIYPTYKHGLKEIWAQLKKIQSM